MRILTLMMHSCISVLNTASSVERFTDVEAMQNCIADIRKWMLQGRLRLNDGKSEFVIIGTRDQLTKVTIDTLQVGETATTPASEDNDLGSWFDRYPKNGYPHKQHM